jgi:anti-sigma regulatory factor (Ser/Thr protein kinase)
VTSDQPVTAVPADPSGNGSGPATVSLDQTFCADNLFALRNAVAAHGGSLGLSSTRVADLVLLAHELASNSVRHGGATAAVPGRLRLWASADPPAVVCEVTDAGPGLTDPDRAGRDPVAASAGDGRGLWIVRQIADVVEIVAGPSGTRITATFLLAR